MTAAPSHSVERDAAILFADLAGFTALTETHGDLDASGVADRFYALARAGLVGDAWLVKTIGDAVMIVAATVEHAVATALALAAAVDAEPSFPALRVGLHAGHVVERGGDVFGAAVNLAARVTAHARSGQILCTEPVASRIPATVCAKPAGVPRFKNVHDPVPIFELAMQTTPDVAAIDPVCRMRVAPASAERIDHAGATYYFCSRACAARFVADPDGYTLSASTDPAR